eukprot:PLAT5587.1.p2 GENE.PLAT5587.1~~PLAT5587.1.p2  ORF type:complete len:472 (+),score=252.61 PLAT5587.1:119-1534(+)
MGTCCSALQADEMVVVKTFTEEHVTSGAGWKRVSLVGSKTKQKGILLQEWEFVTLTHTVTGVMRNVQGPQLVFPLAYEQASHKRRAITLQAHEYVRFEDTTTGVIRVEVGEALVLPSPTEELLDGGKQQAVPVDDMQAVMVRELKTGQLRLVRKPQMWVPAPDEVLERVVKRVRLADHEACVIVDQEGRYDYRLGSGAEDERSFFLEPYTRLLELRWSLRAGSEPDKLVRLDLRPMFMNYEFLSRTSDNVELILDVTFFWQVVNVPMMLRYTDDAPGDLCNHASSLILESVSRVSFDDFLSEFNTIVTNSILGVEDPFYDERGISILNVEVRNIHCKEKSTERVLQAIIQENTNRLARIVKQDSENQVAMHKLKGRIEEEKTNGELLEIRHSHHRAEALMEGEAEADRVLAFLKGTRETIPDVADRVRMFDLLRRVDAMEALAHSDTHLFLTSDDVSLRLEDDSAAAGAAS